MFLDCSSSVINPSKITSSSACIVVLFFILLRTHLPYFKLRQKMGLVQLHTRIEDKWTFGVQFILFQRVHHMNYHFYYHLIADATSEFGWVLFYQPFSFP